MVNQLHEKITKRKTPPKQHNETSFEGLAMLGCDFTTRYAHYRVTGGVPTRAECPGRRHNTREVRGVGFLECVCASHLSKNK